MIRLVYLSRFVKHSTSAAIFPSFQALVEVSHDQPVPANTAETVSLFLLGSQIVQARTELVGGATDPSAPAIEDMGVNHRDAHIAVPKQFLMRGERMARL